MYQNMDINDDNPNKNIPTLVDVHGKLLPDDPGENKQKAQNPAPRPQKYYRRYDDIAEYVGQFSGPLYHRHTFVVTSILMQMLTARG